LKDENGKTIMKPGTLKATKAIGWFIDEYQIAQVSMNITNISVTPLHVASATYPPTYSKKGLLHRGRLYHHYRATK
jgi:hypothetical protein